MSLTDLLLSLVVLAPMGALGSAILWRARLGLDPLEWVAYGVPLGWVSSSLVLYGLSCLDGRLTEPSVLVMLGVIVIATVAVVLSQRSLQTSIPGAPVDAGWRPIGRPTSSAPVTRPEALARHGSRPLWNSVGALSGQDLTRAASRVLAGIRARISWLPVITFGSISAVWVRFWLNAVWYRADSGLTVSSSHFTLDWSMHLGDLASLVYGDNLPMQAPRFADQLYGYHFLATFTAAAITEVGVPPGYALAAHSMIGMLFCLLATYAFARRVLRRTGAAVLATLLFYLGGSFGWLLTVRQFNETGDLWDTVRYHAWGFGVYDRDGSFAWNQVLSYPITAQRAFIYGIPLMLVIVTLLWLGLRNGRYRPFIAAALITGTLPYANGSVILLIPLMVPFLAILFPIRRLSRSTFTWVRAYPVRQWLTFGLIALVLVVPQVYVQQGADASGLEIRWSPGWNLSTPTASGRDPWWWYASKNYGFLLLLIPLAFLLRRVLPSDARRLLLAAMPLFVIAQLVTFQPLEGDNAKLVMLWYVFGAIAAAAALTECWRRARSALLRVALTGIVASMLLTGVLIHVEFIAQSGRIGLARTDELAVGERVRERTSPHARFAAGQWFSNPVLMIGGRSLLVGNYWHVALHGYDARTREAALGEIMRYGPDAEREMVHWDVDYVAISPPEVQTYGADLEAYRARYPLVIEVGEFEIFAVSPEAIARARMQGVPDPADAMSLTGHAP